MRPRLCLDSAVHSDSCRTVSQWRQSTVVADTVVHPSAETKSAIEEPEGGCKGDYDDRPGGDERSLVGVHSHCEKLVNAEWVRERIGLTSGDDNEDQGDMDDIESLVVPLSNEAVCCDQNDEHRAARNSSGVLMGVDHEEERVDLC